MALEGLIAELIASLDKNTAAVHKLNAYNEAAFPLLEKLINNTPGPQADFAGRIIEQLQTDAVYANQYLDAEATPPLEEVKELTYQEMRDAIFAVSKKSRAEADALLKPFGATKITQLKPEQWADAFKQAKAFLAGGISFLGEASQELE